MLSRSSWSLAGKVTKGMAVRATIKGNFKQIMKIREREIQRADKATVRALDRFGAIIRQDARKSIGAPSNKWKSTTKEVWVPTELFGQLIQVPQDLKVGTPPAKPRPGGKPPRSRTNHDFYSLRNIRYISDYSKATVKIGPWRTGAKGYGGQTIPELHEFGGSFTTKVAYIPLNTVTSADLKRVRKNGKNRLEVASSQRILVESKTGTPRTFRMPARPFMRPSYLRHKKQATKIWRDYYRATRRKR
jgi:hypothetical protein